MDRVLPTVDNTPLVEKVTFNTQMLIYRRRRFLSTGAYRDNSDKMGA